MTTGKHILRAIALLLGTVGTAACVAGIIGVWSVSARLNDATEALFQEIDGSLIIVRERVGQARDRIEAAKITTGDIEQSLRDWTQREAQQRLATRLDVAEKTERLASSLEQVDRLLEVSGASAELVRGALSMAGATGAPVDTATADMMIEEIESLRAGLAEAASRLERIHARTDETSGEKSLDEQIEEVVQLTIQLAATLGLFGDRLEEFDDRFPEMQNSVDDLESRISRWITGVTIGIALLFVWMGAGQVALCRLAWTGLRSA